MEFQYLWDVTGSIPTGWEVRIDCSKFFYSANSTNDRHLPQYFTDTAPCQIMEEQILRTLHMSGEWDSQYWWLPMFTECLFRWCKYSHWALLQLFTIHALMISLGNLATADTMEHTMNITSRTMLTNVPEGAKFGWEVTSNHTLRIEYSLCQSGEGVDYRHV